MRLVPQAGAGLGCRLRERWSLARLRQRRQGLRRGVWRAPHQPHARQQVQDARADLRVQRGSRRL